MCRFDHLVVQLALVLQQHRLLLGWPAHLHFDRLLPSPYLALLD
jgi:hypothetical protein